jgi:hypothetical protein
MTSKRLTLRMEHPKLNLFILTCVLLTRKVSCAPHFENSIEDTSTTNSATTEPLSVTTAAIDRSSLDDLYQPPSSAQTTSSTEIVSYEMVDTISTYTNSPSVVSDLPDATPITSLVTKNGLSNLGKRLQQLLNTQRIKPLFIPSLEVDDGVAKFDNVIYRGKNLIRKLELVEETSTSKIFNLTMGSLKIRSSVVIPNTVSTPSTTSNTLRFNETFEGIIRGITGKIVIFTDDLSDSFLRVKLDLHDMVLNEKMVVKRLYLSNNLNSILKMMNQHSKRLLTDPISFYLRNLIETLVNSVEIKPSFMTLSSSTPTVNQTSTALM